MSFQTPPPPPPQQPWQAGPPSAVPPPPPATRPAAPAVARGGRRGGLLATGLGLLVLGIAAVVAGVLVGNSRYDDGVEKLARAPVGCTTTLEFDKAGTYTLYIETEGKIADRGGDCGASGSYRHEGNRPAAELTLVDSDGAEQTLAAASGKDYSAAGAKGSAVDSVKISDPGTYRLTVTSDDTDFAVAVGKDPKGDAESVRNLGIGAGSIVALVGIVLIVLGMRRRGVPTTPAWTQPAYAVPPAAQPTWAPAPPPSQQMPPPPPPGWGGPPPPPQP